MLVGTSTKTPPALRYFSTDVMCNTQTDPSCLVTVDDGIVFTASSLTPSKIKARIGQ